MPAMSSGSGAGSPWDACSIRSSSACSNPSATPWPDSSSGRDSSIRRSSSLLSCSPIRLPPLVDWARALDLCHGIRSGADGRARGGVAVALAAIDLVREAPLEVVPVEGVRLGGAAIRFGAPLGAAVIGAPPPPQEHCRGRRCHRGEGVVAAVDDLCVGHRGPDQRRDQRNGRDPDHGPDRDSLLLPAAPAPAGEDEDRRDGEQHVERVRLPGYVSSMQRDPALEAVFKPVRPPTTFEETVERLGTAIRLGLLAPGSRLPSERDLAEELGISRSTLRQALTTLVQSGHLTSTRGRSGGTFVAERPPLSGETGDAD